MFDVIATGDFYADLGAAEDDRLPESLLELTRAACRERFRRIDRFTQLALIGASRCVGETDLPGGTGLVIGSGMGAVGNTIAVHEQLFVRHKVPRPADFINTLSNSAGYYVARNLGLRAQNVFVSRRSASMEAAFAWAELEFATGSMDLALVGIVDEATAPLRHHAKRLRCDDCTRLAEGSHWFLVSRAAAVNRVGRVLDARTLASGDALTEWCAGAVDGDTILNLGSGVESAALGTYGDLPPFDPGLGEYLSHGAGVLLRYFESSIEQRLIIVGCDKPGRYHVTLAAKD